MGHWTEAQRGQQNVKRCHFQYGDKWLLEGQGAKEAADGP